MYQTLSPPFLSLTTLDLNHRNPPRSAKKNIICSSLFLKMKMKKRGFILINLLERSLTWICGFRLDQKNLTRESTKKIQLITRSNNRSVKVELPDATFTVVPMSCYYNPSNAWFRYNPRCWNRFYLMKRKELTFWFRFRKQMFMSERVNILIQIQEADVY